MIDFTPQHEYLVGIDSDGLCVRHHGTEAQGMFHAEHDQLLGAARRQQVRAGSVRICEPVLEEPGINRFPARWKYCSGFNRRPEVKARGVQVKFPSRFGLDERASRSWAIRRWKGSVDESGDPGSETDPRMVPGNQPAVEGWSAACRPSPYPGESAEAVLGKGRRSGRFRDAPKRR